MSAHKIKSLQGILEIAAAHRRHGRTIVTTNGCFDILHSGHVQTLEWAKTHGHVLIVGIDADESVRKNKGPLRPIIPELERAQVLAGLASVNYIFIFRTENPIPWLEQIKPDIHVKGSGSEKDPRFAPEEAVVIAGGGKLVLAPKVEGLSTTNIVETILERYCRERR